MSERTFDVVVIGAGLNDLTAAAYLAGSGLRTLVLECRSVPGGPVATEEIAPGFRCDTGLHDPGWIPPAVARDLELAGHGLELVAPDPAVCALLPDGGALLLWRDAERTAESIREHSAEDARSWPRFVERMERQARVLGALYDRPPPTTPTPGLGDVPGLLRFGGRLRGLGREGMSDFLRTFPMPVGEVLDEWFDHEALKAVLGGTGCFGVFQGPRSAGTGFVMLHHHVGADPGVFRGRSLVRGGSGRLGEVLAEVVWDRGGEIRYDTEVEKISVRRGTCVGVTLADGQEILARAVVSGADPRRTFLSLVGAGHLDPEFVHTVRNIRYRGAWAKVNLALDGLPGFRGVDDSALAGVITVCPGLDALERAYDDAKYGRVSERPALEVRIPSLADPALAPDGGHVMSILAQYAPYHLDGGGWNEEARAALGDRVVEVLSEHAPDLPDRIVHRQVLTPADLEARFGLTEGDASHGELALDQILFMRPLPGWARYRTPIENLFLCGPGTHPGPGIVGGSGRLAAREVARALER